MSELRVDNLDVAYGGISAVRGVGFSVRGGEVLAIVGPNGAGKSSTARAVMGLVPARGRVLIDGQDLLGLPTHRRAALGVAFVPEGRGLFAPLSVRDNILLGGYLVSSADRSKRLKEVCDLFPVLGRRLDQEASSLSGGEQQMLAVARALMTSPSVLICDEPSMGLAPAVSKMLFDTLREIAGRGAAVIVGDQNARRLFSIASQVCVMRLGSIIARGAPGELGTADALAQHYFGTRAPAPAQERA
ncbi:MAG: ABC transporter ATP-binding protein [Rhizobiaceae bacterium]